MKFEFGSDGWIEAVGDLIGTKLHGLDLTDVQVSWFEEYTNPPPHICDAGRETASWFVVIDQGRIGVGRGVLDAATFWSVGDYDSLLSIARTPSSDPLYRDRVSALRASGRLTNGGVAPTVPPSVGRALGSLHDDIVAFTA